MAQKKYKYYGIYEVGNSCSSTYLIDVVSKENKQSASQWAELKGYSVNRFDIWEIGIDELKNLKASLKMQRDKIMMRLANISRYI